MKNIWLYIFFFCFLACKNNKQPDAVNTHNENNEILDLSSPDTSSGQHWDEFRYGIVNNDTDFDLLKDFDPEQVPPEIAFQLTDDEYTKMTLGITPYESLEDEIFDGISAKAFYVLIAADYITIGTIYYFRETSYGLELLGTMPY